MPINYETIAEQNACCSVHNNLCPWTSIDISHCNSARALCGDSKRFWRLCPCRCAFSHAIHPSILLFRFIPIVQFSVYPPHFHIVSCLRRAATCCLVPHKNSNQHSGVVCIVCVSHSELMMTSTAHEHRVFSLSVLHSAVPSYRSYGIFSHSQSPPSLLHSIFSSTIYSPHISRSHLVGSFVSQSFIQSVYSKANRQTKKKKKDENKSVSIGLANKRCRSRRIFVQNGLRVLFWNTRLVFCVNL